jgi:hypothetical protein
MLLKGIRVPQTCPNCGREILAEYRFCPQCRTNLWLEWNGITMARFFGSVETGKNVHRLAQNKLWKIGKDLGFHSVTDFVPHNIVLQRRSDLIDVVWKTENEIEFAFEIRARAHDLDWLGSHREDLVKLQNLKAKKFFVNVSNKSGKAYFNEVTEELINSLDRQKNDSFSNISEVPKVEEITLFTCLVKSEKNRKICIACVDENKRWIRPIKPGGFEEKDLVMDNGKIMTLFDVVDMKFSGPFPIKHQKENMLLTLGTSIRFVRKLGENEQKILLSRIANTRILNVVSSREELYDELSTDMTQSLVLAGPINLFEIQCNIISGKTHPRIWVVRQNDKRRIFSIACTDVVFCKFIGSRLANFEGDDAIISSQDVAELKNKQIYFVIGLTGDSLDEDNRIKDGKYAPPGSSIQPRYWPLVVSVLTVPNCPSED